jgi:hypothetical protein
MTMQNKDFVAFILTHGRADRVYTYDTLKKCGYTGDIVIVIDNEDKTAKEYHKRFGSKVQVFDKAGIAKTFDEGDNFGDRRAIIYARNACFEIAKKLGYKYFIELDDDYVDFRHKKDDKGDYIDRLIKDMDAVLDAMLDFYKSIPALAIAMAQGGDFVGGKDGNAWKKPKRKAMNSFICSTDRPFQFFGRINEDVNTYTNLGSRGGLFLTTTDVGLQQKQTQSNAGGMTELYLDSGTYVKSFYSIMYQPSSVKISVMHSKNARIHHMVKWRFTVPCILDDNFKKTTE